MRVLASAMNWLVILTNNYWHKMSVNLVSVTVVTRLWNTTHTWSDLIRPNYENNPYTALCGRDILHITTGSLDHLVQIIHAVWYVDWYLICENHIIDPKKILYSIDYPNGKGVWCRMLRSAQFYARMVLIPPSLVAQCSDLLRNLHNSTKAMKFLLFVNGLWRCGKMDPFDQGARISNGPFLLLNLVSKLCPMFYSCNLNIQIGVAK